MTRSFASEWLKLRRPGVLLTSMAGTVGFSVLGIVFGLRRPELRTAVYAQYDGFVQLMSRATDFLGIVALGIAAFALASEYSNGTIRNLLVREPHRLRLLAGKVLAVMTLAGACVLLAYAVAFPVALAVAPGKGIATASWTTGAGIESLLAGAGEMLLSTAGYAILGALLGLALRNPAPAIVAGIAYMLPVEGLLVGSESSTRHVLFGQQMAAIAAGGTAQVALGTALLVGAAWVLGAAVVGGLLFRGRDIVA